MQPRAQPAFPEVSAFLQHLFMYSLEVRAVWLLDSASSQGRHELLIFADRPTLECLRAAAGVRRADLDVLVVVDGDLFESAWGLRKVDGSLARWAWRRVSDDEAYYDESRWGDEAGGVVRMRRRARLLWEAREAVHV
jgi:hypothetical protein